MKWIVVALLCCSIVGCSKTNDSIKETHHSMLLLKVDFVTFNFEGGYEMRLNTTENSDTIPVQIAYLSPGDFGNISLYYKPTNQLFFDGSIFWMGKGAIKYPKEFTNPDMYKKSTTPVEKPDDSRFKTVFTYYDLQSINYNKIWDAIKNLEIVSTYLKSGKKIGIFQYTPSVGLGDPNDWDWFVILNK